MAHGSTCNVNIKSASRFNKGVVVPLPRYKVVVKAYGLMVVGVVGVSNTNEERGYAVEATYAIVAIYKILVV